MRSKTKTQKSPLKSIVAGTCIGIILSLLLISVFAFILTKKDIEIKHLPLFILIAGAIGSLSSSFINTKKLKLRGIFSGLISSLVFSGVYLLICFIASGFSVSLVLLITIPLNTAAGVIGAIISRNLR
ncbi:MAG: TIGR04086 family membrane protein [Oscillospiraceae bacterium]|nr:TIGR04086 family membrane protein [Oscillospiraceae bacterium]